MKRQALIYSSLYGRRKPRNRGEEVWGPSDFLPTVANGPQPSARLSAIVTTMTSLRERPQYLSINLDLILVDLGSLRLRSPRSRNSCEQGFQLSTVGALIGRTGRKNRPLAKLPLLPITSRRPAKAGLLAQHPLRQELLHPRTPTRSSVNLAQNTLH